jgi:hypothetical protein
MCELGFNLDQLASNDYSHKSRQCRSVGYDFNEMSRKF